MNEITKADLSKFTIHRDLRFNDSPTEMCFDYMMWIVSEVDRGKSYSSLWNYYVMVMRGLEPCPIQGICKQCSAAS